MVKSTSACQIKEGFTVSLKSKSPWMCTRHMTIEWTSQGQNAGWTSQIILVKGQVVPLSPPPLVSVTRGIGATKPYRYGYVTVAPLCGLMRQRHWSTRSLLFWTYFSSGREGQNSNGYLLTTHVHVPIFGCSYVGKGLGLVLRLGLGWRYFWHNWH